MMKSWAVPKGPSYDPAVRRLAMEVEDHPIEYNTFEGTIPKGQYGGGTVMVWDRGTYEPEAGGGAQALRDGYERGDLKFVMHGKRLVGGWVLVRMRRDDSDRAQWLLIKHRDEMADASRDVVAEETTSVATGRTMDEIGARARLVWTSNREPRSATRPTAKSASAAKKQAVRKKRPARATRAASRSRA
jgi:bifunctional non-homologous end joining protein LigD